MTESADSDGHVSSWIEGALRSPIGSGGGQFQRFVGRHQTKVPAFCLHNVEALKSVDGWDERFITSQDSDLSMRLISAGGNCGALMFPAFTCTSVLLSKIGGKCVIGMVSGEQRLY